MCPFSLHCVWLNIRLPTCFYPGWFAAGKGAVYGYDAVGSYKRDEYGVMGSGQNFIMPILDNLVRN